MLKICSQCVVIKFLNKTFASLPRKKNKVVIVFWMLFHGIMTTGGVSTQLQSSGLVANDNSTFRNLALAVSGPFMA